MSSTREEGGGKKNNSKLNWAFCLNPKNFSQIIELQTIITRVLFKYKDICY